MRHFATENIQAETKNWKMFNIIKDIQIKSIMRYKHIPNRMAKIKFWNVVTTKQRIAGGKVKWYNCSAKLLGSSMGI